MKLWLLGVTLAVSAPGPGALAAPAPGAPPSLLGITLTRTSFTQVGSALGHAAITRAGGDVRICYAASRAGDRTVVVFTSGAMSGFGLEVGAFELHARAPEGMGLGSCSRSTRVRADLVTSSGLRLGLPEAAVVKLLGAPTERSAGRLVYRRIESLEPAPELRKKLEAAGRALEPGARVQVLEETRLELGPGGVASIAVERSESI
jgi:hypothetical protein